MLSVVVDVNASLSFGYSNKSFVIKPLLPKSATLCMFHKVQKIKASNHSL